MWSATKAKFIFFSTIQTSPLSSPRVTVIPYACHLPSALYYCSCLFPSLTCRLHTFLPGKVQRPLGSWGCGLLLEFVTSHCPKHSAWVQPSIQDEMWLWVSLCRMQAHEIGWFSQTCPPPALFGGSGDRSLLIGISRFNFLLATGSSQRAGNRLLSCPTASATGKKEGKQEKGERGREREREEYTN